MGCGCKNKTAQQSTQLSPQQIKEIEEKRAESSANIKETIRKTVDKYYNKSN
jgi:hypothetical protein